MALTTGQVNLQQIHEALTAAYPARQLPEGWGLTGEREQGSNDSSILDGTGTFSDEEIQAILNSVIYDPDAGKDPDRLSLRDNALGQLDLIIGSVEGLDLTTGAGRNNLLLAVKRLAQIQRRIIRTQHVPDRSSIPTTPD
jgi:hypothetical protein